jgi:hypothetical protein
VGGRGGHGGQALHSNMTIVVFSAASDHWKEALFCIDSLARKDRSESVYAMRI